MYYLEAIMMFNNLLMH